MRQCVPILTGFVGVLCCLLVAGYFYTRGQIIETTRLQVEQMMGSITRQHGYSYRWVETVMGSMLKLATTLSSMDPVQRNDIDPRITGIISDERGKQTVEICLAEENGKAWQRYYDSQGARPIPGENPLPEDISGFTPNGIFPCTAQEVAAFTAPRWLDPVVETAPDSFRFVTIRYSAPVLKAQPDGTQATIGVCTISLAMPWLAERLRAFSFFESSTVFFLTNTGQWTLPEEASGPITLLKTRALVSEGGELPVLYDNTLWLAVFMPLMENSLYMVVLIPQDHLFGSLYTLTQLLAACGLGVLLLAAYSLYRTTRHLLNPLSSLRELAARLARGELEAIPDPQAALPPPPFPDEAQRIKIITEKIRQDLRQRVNDLTLIGRTRERLFGELTFARSLQEKLRPLPLPPMADVEIATFVHTAENVCGDLYDYFLQSPRRLCCVMGNVTERGVPAALLMGRIGPLLHELLLSGLSPAKALASINHTLMPVNGKAAPMISVLAGVLDMDTGSFCWASAGQLPPLRCLGPKAEYMEWTSNVALGIRAEEIYQEKEVLLSPGESLLFAGQRLLSLTGLYEQENLLKPDAQDGYARAQGEKGHEYTEEHVRKFLQNRTEPLEELLPLLYADICHTLGKAPQDDLTFFAIRWQPL